MGSFSSRHKPIDVLPATESWSTLNAFQATVKKNEHHELINRSKTQKSLPKTNSFLSKTYKRRTKTLVAIPAGLSSSAEQQPIVKNHKTIRVKTQSSLSQTSITGHKGDTVRPLPLIEKQPSQNKQNVRRGSHFYGVRQAMVNRQKLQKLESLISEDVLQISLAEVRTQNTIPSYESVDLSEDVIQGSLDKVRDDTVSTYKAGDKMSHEAQLITGSLSIQELDPAEQLSIANPLAVKLEVAEDTQQCVESVVSHADPSAFAFRVDPEPHPTFAPKSQLSDRELECQSTIQRIVSCSSGDLARKEVEELLKQWRDSGQLASIESHALSISPSQPNTIAELADSLVNNEVSFMKAVEGNKLHLQIATAYCIYVWIANNITYDVDQWKAIISGDEDSLTRTTEAEVVLNTRVAVCTGYANLFKALASTCGLGVEVIYGHARSWKSLSEKRPDADTVFKQSRQNSHTWNSVVFGSTSYLLDCTFASGYVTSTMSYCKYFSCHYFAVPPHQFILTHWPSNETWKLLDEPLTLEKLQPLIPVPSSTIGLGIEPDTWSEVVEILDDPVACIQLRCKENVAIFATLLATNNLKKEDFSTKTHQGKFTFIKREENSVSIRAAPPHKGQFILNIYACDNSSTQNYRLVLSYLIQNTRQIVSQVGYPIVGEGAAVKFNFRPLHWNAPNGDYCCEVPGRLDVIFRARPDLHFYHCIMPGERADFTNPSPALASNKYHFNTMVVQNEVGDPGLHMLHTIFPTQGWWTLYLYAKKSEIDTSFETSQSNAYDLVLLYNVYVLIGIPEQSYPNILSPFISMLQPESISASGDEIFSFYFNSSKIFDFHSYLTFDRQTSVSMDNFTAIENVSSSSQHTYRLNIIFSKPGNWYVHAFGRDNADPRQTSYSGLFVLQIKVDGSLKNTTFPKVNQALANTLNIKFLNSGSITFQDDGSPFAYKLLIPKGIIDLIHNIKPHSARDANFNEELLQHCTSLSFDKHAEDSIPPDHTECTLNAVFPWAGTWTVQVFASFMGSKHYECLIEVNLHVGNPTPCLCYIKVHPSFYHLDLSIPEQFLSYNPTSDSSEIKIPFNAPENVQFVWNMEFVKSGEKVFQQAIVHHQENPNQSYIDSTFQNRILHLIFPKPGEWIFHLYGRIGSNELQDERHNYQTVFEIRINASSFNNEFRFPHTFDSFRNVFGMKLDEEKLPLISKVHSIPSVVCIPFYSPPNVKLWYDIEVNHSLVTQPTAQLRNVSECLHKLVVEVNRKGKWNMILYAQLADSHKKNWTAVLKHTVSSE